MGVYTGWPGVETFGTYIYIYIFDFDTLMEMALGVILFPLACIWLDMTLVLSTY